jgi:hypothetical protein
MDLHKYTFVSPASESRRPVTLIWVKHQKEDYTYIDFVRMNIRVSIYFYKACFFESVFILTILYV